MNATKPTLITTFIGTQALTPLVEHLARPEIKGGLALDQEEAGVWKNHDESIFAIPVGHPELPDVTLIQLVINPGGEAPDAWQRAAGQLERARRELPKESEEALLGTTLVYQAVLPPNADPDDSFVSLLDQFHLLSSKGYLYTRALASRAISGGKLWLLESALQGERNVYIALGTEAEQATLTYEVLFDEDAALLWADTIAHKAYYMLRDYGDAERDTYREATNALTERVQTILAEKRAFPTDSQSRELAMPADSHPLATLNDLSSKAAKFTYTTVMLQNLQRALEIHRFNLNLAAQHFATRMGQDSNPITTYHLQRLEHNIFRIRQDLATASATQEALNTAINYLRAIEEHKQTLLAKRQQESNHKIQIAIAVLGVIVGVGQIVESYLGLALMPIMLIIAGGGWLWYQRREGRETH